MRRLTFAAITALVALTIGAPGALAAGRSGAKATKGGGGTTGGTQSVSSTPDPFEGEQWAVDANHVNARGAWSTSTGLGAVVAVVDTGVDKDHPEMTNLTSGASWIDCGKKVKPPCFNSSQWDDQNGHGTHVSGIIAAPVDGIGTVGVAPLAKIMPVRVLDADGSGSSSDVAAGIRWAADHGANVINLSLGGLPVVSNLFDATGLDSDFSDAVAYASSKNVLVVTAAGNDGAPICDDDSFRLANAICVGATDKRDVKAWYGNFGGGAGGDAATPGLDVSAPGGLGSVFCDDNEDVLSTYAINTDTVCTRRVGYETLAGTSMATPHVSGVGALLAARGVKGAAAAQRILATADDLGTPGWDPVFGYGRINAARAVAGL